MGLEFLWQGLLSITWQQAVMYVVGAVLIWLAIEKGFEPALLMPMGFGAILVNLPLSGVMNQVSAGVGETHGIIRIGPSLSTRYKHWESAIGYFLSGTHGESPFEFDRYRYGKSTITMNEKFHFNDKFALGFRLFITPMKDNIDNDLFTECRFYFSF